MKAVGFIMGQRRNTSKKSLVYCHFGVVLSYNID